MYKCLRQLGFTYSTCGPFTKSKIKIQKFKGGSRYIYRNRLDKTLFHHDIAYREFKDLPKRTASGKVLRDKAFEIASNQKYGKYQRRLASVIFKSFDKKAADISTHTWFGIGISENQELCDELCEQTTKKFKRCKIH